jgi:hypothetical protein
MVLRWRNFHYKSKFPKIPFNPLPSSRFLRFQTSPQGERDDGAHLAVFKAAVATVKRCDTGDRQGVTKRKQSSGAVPTLALRSLARAAPTSWRGRRHRGPRAGSSRLGVTVLDSLRLPRRPWLFWDGDTGRSKSSRATTRRRFSPVRTAPLRGGSSGSLCASFPSLPPARSASSSRRHQKKFWKIPQRRPTRGALVR